MAAGFNTCLRGLVVKCHSACCLTGSWLDPGFSFPEQPDYLGQDYQCVCLDINFSDRQRGFEGVLSNL